MIFRSITLIVTGILLSTAQPARAMVSNVLLEDFEGGPGDTASGAKVTTANSSSTGDSFSSVPDNVLEGGSNRLRFRDPGGTRNGITFTIPNAFTEGGNYLITADVKVDNSSDPVVTMGIAGRVGGTSTAKIDDRNAGYVMNLEQYPTTAASLGYQTVGLAIQVPTAGPFPQSLTLYVSTDPSGNTFNGANDGDFTTRHRGGSTATWATNPNTNAVYIDNIRRIGPGNFGEERHAWISIGDGFTNLATLESLLVAAQNNNFNCVDILVRYRANRYYRKNRDFSTYTHNEPFASGASDANDPIQYAIDRGHELGMKVFASFSSFLVTDGSNTYPTALPSGSQTYWYNDAGTPVAQTTTHDGEGIWADVGRADVRAHTINVLKDLVQNYDLDGVIFDRIRYANPEFGYNPTALSEMGYAPGTYPLNGNTVFEGRRQDTVTTFLHDAYEAATDLKPWIIVGTVPIAYGSDLDSTYQQVYQSWPKWSRAVTRNRAFSFGAQDCIQPQFYRQWDSASPFEAPASNQSLMRYAQYGDTSAGADPTDFGLMPGANVMLAPLFYTSTLVNATDRINTGNAIAQNICDTQSYPTYAMNGSGIWRMGVAVSTATGDSLINSIRASVPTCGGDVLASPVAQPDYLMKAGYDNTPPNNISNLTADNVSVPSRIILNWTAPAAAADGETPTRYLVYRSNSSPVQLYYANLVNKNFTVATNSFTDATSSGLTAGNKYYRVVPVDDYNNKADSNTVGPVAASIPADYIIETATAISGAQHRSDYVEGTGNWQYSSAESVIPGGGGLTTTRDGSRFAGLLVKDDIARFTPVGLTPGDNVYEIYYTNHNVSSANAPNSTFRVMESNGTLRVGTYDPVYNLSGNIWVKYVAAGGVSQFTLNPAAGPNQAYLEVTDSSSTGAADNNVRFCTDAVKFVFIDSAAPVPVTVSGFSVE